MAYLEGTCTTGGVVTPGVKVYAFRTGQWGAPASGISDFEGKWRVEGLVDDVPYDVAFVHPDGQWEGKMSSRRMPIFDPFADPYWEDTTLLVHFDDVAGQTPTNERGIIGFRIGGIGASISDNAPTPKFGTGALNINNGATSAGFWFGTGASTGIVADTNPMYMGSTDNFTVEGWFYCRSGVATNTYRDICILAANDKGVVINGSSRLVYYDGGIKIEGPSMTDLYDKWVWLVVQRENGITGMWLDGQRIGTFGDTGVKNAFRIGSNTQASEQFFGGLDEWRHTRAARYPGSPVTIEVPTAPFTPGNPIRSDSFTVPRLWNYEKIGGTANWEITAGRLNMDQPAGTPAQTHFVRRDFTSQNLFCEAEIFQAQDSGFMWRFVDENNYYMISLMDDQSPSLPNTARIYKRVGGSFTKIGETPITLTRGSANKVRVEMTGTTITLVINGASIGTYTDSAISVAGRIGFKAESRSEYNGQLSVDNFKWDTLL
ncbi:hypothetical protein CPT_Mendera_235 [Stenotrophomonas phage Mendera]|uniref:Uncharacterized protein n=1 Tax=Stenotrophomonas phage Mendera TaxID=2650877 RepID=A0A5P8PJ54_9CAUD|nr:hypothetical protein HWC60_gp180 [Stenotrophomonas phage Mendera]QFR56761.1 hypothetical protein CPT_Mendera_235 [Stenotrophomonas phage Mendera]